MDNQSKDENDRIDAFRAVKAEENYTKSRRRALAAAAASLVTMFSVVKCTETSEPISEVRRVANAAIPTVTTHNTTEKKVGYGLLATASGVLALGFGVAAMLRRERGNRHRDNHFAYYPETAKKEVDLDRPSADRS